MNIAKRKILQAASELFLEGGIAALSVRSIAKHAGVSTIGIYSHFQGKEGILDELYIQGFELVMQAMDFEQHDLSPKEVMRRGIRGYFAMAEAHEGHYRLIFGENDSRYTPSEEAKNVAEKAFGQLLKVTALLLPDDANMALKHKNALEIWAFVHGYVSLKHHAVASIFETPDWYVMAEDALCMHIDAILATHTHLNSE
ncbi:transcriptional regulator, TetR family protein [Paraglaciecola mesophila KMM 241]|uniref:Transcriptional regulator, TetR family protein n=1 Tax=Paraglaciecola mesophila KMM 241 TaxID=1128912 RepID=K6YFT4_9ALTE|nr:TetR/AcrR family transcriptional regulator [Paraglaciecola mesophila]GAC22806.1 transcriptional regulator, TetR family protein [Paraglaciecola mesophila KMM 241]